jgi:hypothetical protein
LGKLQVKPALFPPHREKTRDEGTVELHSDLPEPVYRHLLAEGCVEGWLGASIFTSLVPSARRVAGMNVRQTWCARTGQGLVCGSCRLEIRRPPVAPLPREKTHTAPRLTSRARHHGQSLQPVGDGRPNFRPLVERHSFLELAEPQLFLEDPKRLRLRSPAGTLSPSSSVARAGKRPAPCGGRAATSLWRRAESCNPKRGPTPPPSASPFSSRGTCCPPCFCPEPKPPAFSGEASTGTVARQDG